MEFGRENKIEAIADLNRAFAEKMDIDEIPHGLSREGILKLIQRANEECFSVLAAFNNAWLAYDYVRGDKELKMKVEEVWKMEVERHKEAFEETKDSMFKMASEMKVDLEPLQLRLKYL